MSRIGRLPVALPDGVKVHVADGVVRVEGPKGRLSRDLTRGMELAIEGRTLTVKRPDDSRDNRGLHGLTRRLVSNMVEGVSKGFTRILEINGVGYRAEVRDKALWFTLGYSHPICFQLPAGVTAKVEKQVAITLESADRELLGQVAAQVRELRPPEPYKGKGVKYSTEKIKRKAGKAAAGGAR
ncbi:MAG: 50S ribosomal protein L6 [Candidatus Binatia bacterium]